MSKSIDDTPFVRTPGTPLKDECQIYMQHGYADVEYGIRILVQWPGHLGGHTRWECQTAAEKILNAMRMDENTTSEKGKQEKTENLASLMALFEGFAHVIGSFQEIPNGYSRPDDAWYVNRPWYKVHTLYGTLIVGWRKRVINLDWSGMLTVPSGKKLFPEEKETTVGKDYIHIWTKEQGQKFVAKILEYAMTCPKVLKPDDLAKRSDY